MVHGSTPSGKRVVQTLPLRMISRMSATNNVGDLGETNAQRLTAIERCSVRRSARPLGRRPHHRGTYTEDHFKNLMRGFEP